MFKLFKENKENGEFIKTVVLPCSNKNELVPDCRKQIYKKEEIAILLSTEANNCLFDFNHNNKKLDGIYTIENYQSKVEEYVNDVRVPVGSWIKIIFSENDWLNENIKNGTIKGVSNDFGINTTKPYCKCNKNLNPGINTNVYNDIAEKECIIQHWLSFVDYPCNFMPLESYSYDEYKIKNGENMKLTEKLNKLWNKEPENKEYIINNNDDLIRVINEISADKVEELKANLEQASMLIAEDIDFIQQDLSNLKEAVDNVLGDNPQDDNSGDKTNTDTAIANEDNDTSNNDTNSNHTGSDNADTTINNENKESLKNINETLEKIQNRLDNIEDKQEKVKTIRNNAFLKNLNKGKETRGFLNRNKN